jgi:hypothetical protein
VTAPAAAVSADGAKIGGGPDISSRIEPGGCWVTATIVDASQPLGTGVAAGVAVGVGLATEGTDAGVVATGIEPTAVGGTTADVDVDPVAPGPPEQADRTTTATEAASHLVIAHFIGRI